LKALSYCGDDVKVKVYIIPAILGSFALLILAVDLVRTIAGAGESAAPSSEPQA